MRIGLAHFTKHSALTALACLTLTSMGGAVAVSPAAATVTQAAQLAPSASAFTQSAPLTTFDVNSHVDGNADHQTVAELAAEADQAEYAADAATAAAMPAELKAAITRDLDMTPAEWVTATRLATEGSALVGKVRAKHPESYSSATFDSTTGRTTISVTTASTRDYAQSLGLAVKLVPWSEAQLKAISREFYAALTPEQQATIISMTPDASRQTVAVRVKVADGKTLEDYPTGELPVSLALAAPDEVKAPATAAANPLPDGSGIYLNASCSLGFGAQDTAGKQYWLTAGHCAQDGRAEVMNTFLGGQVGERIGALKWFQFGEKNVNGSNWPGSASNADISAYEVTPGSSFAPTPQVNTYGAGGVFVDGIADPTTGMPVCRSGITTGWQCGSIRSTDQQPLVSLDVLPGQRPVDAFDMTMCSLPGDSGGPVMAGNLAVGTLSAVTNQPSATDPSKCDLAATNGNQGQHTFAVSVRQSLAGTGLFLLQRVLPPTVKSVKNGDIAPMGPITLNGTGTPGDDIIVRLNGAQVGAAVVDGNGVWQFADARITTTGETVISAQAKRDAVNISSETKVTVSGTAAVASVQVPRPGSAILAAPQEVRGSATPNATVKISLNGAQIGLVQANAAGDWVLPNVPFVKGSAIIEALPSIGGKPGRATSATYQVNEVKVAFGTPVSEVFSGAQNLQGTATPGAQVLVKLNGTEVAKAVAGADSLWRVSVTLPAGAAVLRAEASINGVTATADLTLDVNRIAAPTITGPAPGATLRVGLQTLTGTAPAGSVVSLKLNGNALGAVTASADGKWSLPNVMFNAGSISLTATSSYPDPGIVSLPGLANYAVQAPAPAVRPAQNTIQGKDLVIAQTPKGAIVPGLFTVKGTAPVGSKVTITLNNKVVGVANVVSTIPNATSASWSMDVTLAPGANVVGAVAAMGGQSVATSQTLSVLMPEVEATETSAAATPTPSATTTATKPATSETVAAGTVAEPGRPASFWVSLLGGIALLLAAAWMFIGFRRKNAK